MDAHKLWFGNIKPTEAEQHNLLEQSHAWIRNLNEKLYDKKITTLAQYTSDGREILRQEIEESEHRLQQVKLGVKVNDLVPQMLPSYFMTSKDSYFSGMERRLRECERLRKETKTTVAKKSDEIEPADGGFFLTASPDE